ncbi:MAG: ParB/RepB/Spo0J family partition protein [Chloroflexi bacterium]|nr:ParB/RepB/Spo0J family partition protein [Chloroflexota bacterium]MDA8189656.1 ParB/RepB/Spo0J family partition protein [Dehalococcoidales bacterium]
MAKPKFTIPPVKTSQAIGGVDKEILTKTVDDGVYPLAMAKEIRLDRIQPDPNQPRRTFDEERLAELAASIREQGVLQPIVVEYIDEGNYFRLVHGERRWRAANLAALQTIPAIIRKVDDNTRLARQLIENIQREDLNDVDRARALKQLKENLGSPSWDFIAEKVGITKRRVLQLVDITKLPEPIQENIRSGELTEKHGRAAKMLPEEKQLEFAETVRQQQLSGDESIEVAKTLKTEPALPIGQAIAQVKERQAQERKARTTRIAPPEKATVEEQGPEIVRVLIEQPAREPADPLAPLEGIPAMLGAVDVSQVDAARLRELLEEIIARAQEVLARVKADQAVPTA